MSGNPGLGSGRSLASASVATSPLIPDSGSAARSRLPRRGALYAVLMYAGIRALGYASAAFLLPRWRIAALHYSLWHLIVSWDSGRYLIIAAHGYSYIPGDLRHDVIYAWFPGYPAAIDAVAWIPGVSLDGAGLFVTIAAGLATAWGLARLVMTLTGDLRISLLTTALWAVGPGSIVLSILYSEALFCALAVWALVALAERHWLTAAFLTALAGTVRSTTMALVVAIVVAAVPVLFQAVRGRGAGTLGWWRPAVAVVLAPLGLIGYWAVTALSTHHTGGWFWVEKNAHNGFDWGQSTARSFQQAIMHGAAKPVALTLLVIAVVVILAGFTCAERIPLSVRAYTLTVVLIAVLTGPYYLGSKPRFLLPALLLGLPVARVLARAQTWLLVPLIVVLTAASTWFGLYLMSIGWAP
jgi:Gpi18-like mannosyltransferase